MKQMFRCKIQHLNHMCCGTLGKGICSENGWNGVHRKSSSKHVHHRERELIQPHLEMGNCSLNERIINQQELQQDEVWPQPWTKTINTSGRSFWEKKRTKKEVNEVALMISKEKSLVLFNSSHKTKCWPRYWGRTRQKASVRHTATVDYL